VHACLLTTAAASSDASDTSLASSLPARGTCFTASSTGDSQPEVCGTTQQHDQQQR
jgi:hypothetical protein